MCAQVDGDRWFPDAVYQGVIPAGICRDWCPVAGECLAEAFAFEAGLSADYRYGIWGGLTPRERWVFDPSEPVEVRDSRVKEWLYAQRLKGRVKVDAARVAELTVDGVADPEIARRLGVSPRSVRRARAGVAS